MVNIVKCMKMAAVCLGIIILYVVILMIGQAIPREWIADNVQASYQELGELGTYFTVVDGATWDNWTDAILLNSTVTEYEGTLLEKALANAYTIQPEGGIVDYIYYAIFPNEESIVYPYSRYWVGNLTLYKLLLIFMPISGIRVVCLMLAVIFLVITIINIYKDLGWSGVVPFLLAVLISLYIPNSMCLVYIPDILLMFIAINICCHKLKNGEGCRAYCILFGCIGSVCAYVNYWAFPLITLGIPLVYLTSVKLRKGYDHKILIKENILISVCWTVGLCGTVLLKQLLCNIILGSQNGLSALAIRVGEDTGIMARIQSTIRGVLNEFSNITVMMIVIFILLAMTLGINKGVFKKNIDLIPLILIACYPVAWWFLLVGHSNHGFVRYMFGVSYYALFSIIFLNCDEKKLIADNGWWKEKRKKLTNVFMLGIWCILSLLLWRNFIHFDTIKTEPWALDVIDYIALEGEISAVQEVSFQFEEPVYLKNMETIFINITEEERQNKEAKIHIDIIKDGRIILSRNIPVNNIIVGEWTKIPIGCTIYPHSEYEISYSVVDAEQIVPYLLLQDENQGVSNNGIVNVDGIKKNGVLANQYEYDHVLSGRLKIYITVVGLFILQIIFSCLEQIVKSKSIKEKVEVE